MSFPRLSLGVSKRARVSKLAWGVTLWGAGFVAMGCSDGATTDGAQGGASAGAAASGGLSSGGTTGASGGTGGVVASGGTVSSGGSPSGGSSATGGDAGTGGSPTDVPGWTLVWNDEFDGAAGTTVDGSKWTLDTGPNSANAELEYYRPENAAHDGAGHMIITAKKEEYKGYHYTSAKFTSWGKFTPTYGRFDARIRLPRGQGMWPAFWALGTDIGDVGWPTCGELDIMETIGSTMKVNHGSMHGPGYSGGSPLTGTYTLSGGGDFGDDFHVFTLEWEENVTRFYVDGNLYETHTPADVPAGKKWVFDHDIFMILNVAVGGTWPGNPDDSIFPQTMSIDYVRVYSR